MCLASLLEQIPSKFYGKEGAWCDRRQYSVNFHGIEGPFCAVRAVKCGYQYFTRVPLRISCKVLCTGGNDVNRRHIIHAASQKGPGVASGADILAFFMVKEVPWCGRSSYLRIKISLEFRHRYRARRSIDSRDVNR